MNIDDELERLRQIQPVEAPPFLLTRIRARLRGQEMESTPRSWQWAGALAFSLLLLGNVLLLSSREQDNGLAQYGIHQSQQLYAD